MKKFMLFGAVLSVLILLMMPNISAVNTNEVVERNKIKTLGLFQDPDGPLEGGLDDFKDIGWLVKSLFSGGVILFSLLMMIREYRDGGGDALLYYLTSIEMAIPTIGFLIEAFDIRDSDGDGF